MKKLNILTQENDKTINDVMENYFKKCRVRGLTDNTIVEYKSHLSVFERFVGGQDTIMYTITAETVDSFIIFLKDSGTRNDITINSYLRSVRPFLYYAMELDFLEGFTFKLLKADKKIKETYTEAELKLLLKKPNLKTANFTEYSIWALSNFLLGTGMRISSALSIRNMDISFENATVQINKSKSRKGQIIPLSGTLSGILSEYMAKRKGNSESFLFCNAYGEQANRRTVQQAIAKYNKRRGVMKTSAHLYRHTFAKNWIMNGGDIFRLQKILGHSDLSIVREYVNMFNRDLGVDFDKFNPLDNLSIQQSKLRIKI